jgi:hypothetical protein
MIVKVIPSGLEAFAVANDAAGQAVSAAGSADSAAMLSAVAAAVGPIGATFLAAYGPAQVNNLAGAQMVGGVHTAMAGATALANTSFVAADNA